MNTMEDEDAALVNIALGMYANEPCRICGKLIEVSDLKDAVFAGYSQDSTSRSAHKACWDKQLPQAEWAIPREDPPRDDKNRKKPRESEKGPDRGDKKEDK
jgi:hypothetical protein